MDDFIYFTASDVARRKFKHKLAKHVTQVDFKIHGTCYSLPRFEIYIKSHVYSEVNYYAKELITKGSLSIVTIDNREIEKLYLN